MISLKKGASIRGISGEITFALYVAASVYARLGYDIVVTSGTEGFRGDGIHGDTSLHYDGQAVDLRIRHMINDDAAKAVEQIAEALGDEYDVVLESNHIHLEFDAA